MNRREEKKNRREDVKLVRKKEGKREIRGM